MPKKIEVTDRQYDWLQARAHHGQSLSKVIGQVIALIEQVEHDLQKYRRWFESSQIIDKPNLTGTE